MDKKTKSIFNTSLPFRKYQNRNRKRRIEFVQMSSTPIQLQFLMIYFNDNNACIFLEIDDIKMYAVQQVCF